MLQKCLVLLIFFIVMMTKINMMLLEILILAIFFIKIVFLQILQTSLALNKILVCNIVI